jgi:hypothetical protein
MALTNLSVKQQNKCMMCDGGMEKANVGNICNTCKDKMRKL